MMDIPSSQLVKLVTQTRKELLLVAPFIKFNTLQKLLGYVDKQVQVQCITRWRPDEIASGISDLEVWTLIKNRPNSNLWLRSDLHAKYYRGDQQVLIGSANLTHTALGWSRQPNLELLVSADIQMEFEQVLLAGSVPVDDSIYEHIRDIVDNFPIPTQPDATRLELSNEDERKTASIESWLPMLRRPEKLYVQYIGNFEQLDTGSRIAAMSDLEMLDVPLGLTNDAFEAYIGVQLLQKPIIRQVDQFVETPQRFGAVRDFLRTLPCGVPEEFDADIAWQTLMRWLLYFLPNKYYAKLANHSEIFARKDIQHD